jgi:hypothetical protein
MSGHPPKQGVACRRQVGGLSLPSEKLFEARERAKSAIEQILFGLKFFFLVRFFVTTKK